MNSEDYQLELCNRLLKDNDLKDWRVEFNRGCYYFIKRFAIFNSDQYDEDSVIRIKKSKDLWELSFKQHTGKWEKLPLEIQGPLLRFVGSFEECIKALQSDFLYLLTNL